MWNWSTYIRTFEWLSLRLYTEFGLLFLLKVCETCFFFSESYPVFDQTLKLAAHPLVLLLKSTQSQHVSAVTADWFLVTFFCRKTLRTSDSLPQLVPWHLKVTAIQIVNVAKHDSTRWALRLTPVSLTMFFPVNNVSAIITRVQWKKKNAPEKQKALSTDAAPLWQKAQKLCWFKVQWGETFKIWKSEIY